MPDLEASKRHIDYVRTDDPSGAIREELDSDVHACESDTITLTITIPPPLREPPKEGTECWIVRWNGFSRWPWGGDNMNYRALKAGVLHATEANAKAHWNALYRGQMRKTPREAIMWDKRYRLLKEGERVRESDEVDSCNDGWRDPPKWVSVSKHSVGTAAPNPNYPSHRRFRRRIASRNNP